MAQRRTLYRVLAVATATFSLYVGTLFVLGRSASRPSFFGGQVFPAAERAS